MAEKTKRVRGFPMHPLHPFGEYVELETRRQFFGRSARGLGLAALAYLLPGGGARNAVCAESVPQAGRLGGLPGVPHFPPRAKRAIYLFMSGAPSQIDLFDYRARA
jgi:hypothetical protein